MNQDEIIAELIKLNTEAFINIDAAKEVISKHYQTLIFLTLQDLNVLLNDLQNLHCDIEINLIELKNNEKI